MKNTTGFAIGCGAYAIALLAMAPATLADARLQDASRGRLRIAEAHGTLWSGSGWIEFVPAGARAGASKSFSWRIAPAALLLGRLAYDIGTGPGSANFRLTVTPARVELSDADVSLPAAVLAAGIAQLAPLGLEGELAIRVARLTIEREAAEIDATLLWRAAGSALSPVSPLGVYEMRLEGANRTIRALLRTLSGPLELEGRGSWTRGSAPAFEINARVPPAQQPQLSPLLRLIGVERAPGNFDLAPYGAAPLR